MVLLRGVRAAARALLLRSGRPLPDHVAFIMDGNRRFADQHGLLRIDGHRAGYNQMKDIIQWCLELGVGCVSVYAFSIDNFRRPACEVDALMELATAKFEELLNDPDAKAWGAELRVIGDLSLAPPKVQAAAARLMVESRAAAAAAAASGCQGQQQQRIVNICFSYTSSQELAAASGQLGAGLAESELLPGDVTPGLLHRVMHTQDCPPVDLLIRTSGEQRLSDFLLWQSAHALLHWEACLWPELGYAQLLRAVRAWQDAAPALAALRGAAAAALGSLECSQQQELLLAGSCSGSGAASPPVQLPPYGAGAGAAAPVLGGGGPISSSWLQQQQQQAQDTHVLDQLQRSSEVLAQLQKQQAHAMWWGGLLFSSSSSSSAGGAGGGGGNSSSGGLLQSVLAAAPTGRSPERASSTSLSVISEDEAAYAPHPWQPLRLEGWLRRLEHDRQAALAAAAAAAAVTPTGGGGAGGGGGQRAR